MDDKINKNGVKRLIVVFFGFLVIVAALGILAVWRSPDLSNMGPLQNILPEEMQNILTQGNEPIEKVIGGRLKLSYPASWLTIEQEGFLQGLAPQDWAEKYSLQVLFLAQNFQGGPSQLIVYKGTFNMPTEEIMKEKNESNERQGWVIEELNSGEFRYRKDGTVMRTKEKILTAGQETYLVSLVALETDWPNLKNDIDKIIDSATIVN